MERIQARRRLSRRRILASVLGVGVLGVAAGTAFGVFSTDSEQADQPDAPRRVDPGPAKTPLWTKRLAHDSYQLARSGRRAGFARGGNRDHRGRVQAV